MTEYFSTDCTHTRISHTYIHALVVSWCVCVSQGRDFDLPGVCVCVCALFNLLTLTTHTCTHAHTCSDAAHRQGPTHIFHGMFVNSIKELRKLVGTTRCVALKFSVVARECVCVCVCALCVVTCSCDDTFVQLHTHTHTRTHTHTHTHRRAHTHRARARPHAAPCPFLESNLQ